MGGGSSGDDLPAVVLVILAAAAAAASARSASGSPCAASANARCCAAWTRCNPSACGSQDGEIIARNAVAPATAVKARVGNSGGRFMDGGTGKLSTGPEGCTGFSQSFCLPNVAGKAPCQAGRRGKG